MKKTEAKEDFGECNEDGYYDQDDDNPGLI